MGRERSESSDRDDGLPGDGPPGDPRREDPPPGAVPPEAAAMSRAGRGKSTPVVAVDTGGTFTDLLLLDGGFLKALKLPSTPQDPAAAVLEGVSRLLGDPPPAELLLVHGSTVATNAILERKGARVFLVTNEGFEDVIEIGRQNRPQLYALSGSRPPPLVAREDRLGVTGRIGPDGEEITPLDPKELAALPGRLEQAEAVAVVLLHSYGEPAHERTVAEALAKLEVPVFTSSVILPEFREYERTSTTVANAYVAPHMERYLGRLSAAAGEGRVRMMGSNGGALPLERAISEPIRTVLSGPAGGVVGALEWGRRSGVDHLLSFDMGGTSTDVSLVPGEMRHTREGNVGGVPVAVPLLDIHTVGAGGGSIARVDAGGALRVGPGSAGALPGPICYGRGGTEVTVTDAHVWLGRLPEEAFLGGMERLDREAVSGPLLSLADRMGVSQDEAAEGVIEVVNTSMERALRVISVERGADPGDFHLVAFGGAAGLHAAELVERLGLAGALIPPDPGLLSAFGMLTAPVVRDRSRTVFFDDRQSEGGPQVRRILDELAAEAGDEMVREGVEAGLLKETRWVDARYRGQSFELTVPAEGWVEAFHEAHEARFGYRRPDTPVEAVTLRARVEAPGPEVPIVPGAAGESGEDPTETTVVGRGGSIRAAMLTREALLPGGIVQGPAVITEYSATTWCPPGWRIERDRWGVLHLGPTVV